MIERLIVFLFRMIALIILLVVMIMFVVILCGVVVIKKAMEGEKDDRET